ncbi:MAG: DUF5696 domain-containing protein, partial [bacterium]
MLASTVIAFDGHRVEGDNVVLEVEGPQRVTAYEQAIDVPVRVANQGSESCRVGLFLTGLVDEFRSLGESRTELTLGAGETKKAKFRIVAGHAAETALYPVRIQATIERSESRRELEAVRVFATRFPETASGETASEGAVTTVPRNGVLPLCGVEHYSVSWNYLEGPDKVHTLPSGWQGQDEKSRATVAIRPVNRGETRRALSIHPPYQPRAGTLWVEYPIRLPESTPLKLVFFNAIRDSHENEPLSDGVTFRVRVRGVEEELEESQIVFQRHTDSKRWLAGEVDLAPWAGKQIQLLLESHPGPAKNTVCDSSYWGDPTIIAGNGPRVLADEERAELRESALKLLEPTEKSDFAGGRFALGSANQAAVVLGPNGIADAAIAFASDDRTVVFDGLPIEIDGQPVGQWPAGVICEDVDWQAPSAGKLTVKHRLRTLENRLTLTAHLHQDGDGLRLKLDTDRGRITDSHLGPANQLASRVYYGHGYCIENPRPFVAHAGGHNLATSHVGMDFDQGISLLVGSDTPVDRFEVDPERQLYALHVHPSSEFTFVPGSQGAMDCAIRYRPLYRHAAADGVAGKAGRFVFDLWGGRYDDTRKLLQQAFRYGLHDSLVVFHNWQRWGYDYRLPDIYPPNPQLGTLRDMQQLAALCREHNVPFAVHDNYIDFYPDAKDFSYDHIVFTEQGEPMKAWINLGRDAQSYRWRPDRFQPFLERNLELIKKGFQPTAYFVDVFASANSFDFYDRSGKLHSKLETREHWGKAFDTIRETLGENAPTISEAGSDHLIGHLDGSDCQFLQLSDESLQFRHRVLCDDWQRVPWFDVVNHTRLSLHGVGYSSRYQSYRSRELHGITSDDYISAEILTGHALMIDRQGMIEQAVRKYWLAQAVARHLADDEIVDVQFLGSPDRQLIVWKSGVSVYVNRGSSDWEVAGKVLPRYGYLVQGSALTSSIERIEGNIVEQSHSGNTWYVNGRGFSIDQLLKITPRAREIQHLGDRQFRLLVDWQADEPAPKDLTVFMHFFRPVQSRRNVTGFYGGGGQPRTPTSKWSGTITTGQDWVVTVPEDLPPGKYDILVGLYDPQ